MEIHPTPQVSEETPWPLLQGLVTSLPSKKPRDIRALAARVGSAVPPSALQQLEQGVEGLGARWERMALTAAELFSPSYQRLLPLMTHNARAGWITVARTQGQPLRVLADGEAAWVECHSPGDLCGRLKQSADEVAVWARVYDPLLPSDDADDGSHAHNSPWTALRGLLRDEYRTLWTALVYAAGTGVLTLLIPVAVQALVNTLGFLRLVQPLLVVGGMLTAGLIFSAVLRALQWLAVEHLQQRLFVRVVLDATWRLANASGAPVGASHANRYFDLFLLQKGVAILAMDGSTLLLQLLVSALLLGAYHPFLLVLDLVLVGGVGVLTLVAGKAAVRTALKESHSKHALGAWIQSMAQQHSAATKNQGMAQAEDLARGWLQARQTRMRHVFMQLCASLGLGVAANAGVLLVGGWLVAQGQLSVGQLVAAELVVSALAGSLSKLGKYLETFCDVLASASKVAHLQDVTMNNRSENHHD